MPNVDQPRSRGDIQGLRAVAVLLVVAGHAGVTQVSGGYVGVDVFFVISGFLITGILLRDMRRAGSVLDFYARRARRILPAATLVLLTTSIATWLILEGSRLRDVLADVVWAASFGANIRFAVTESDYFRDDTFVSPVQHYWSLAVEEQFYVVWPLLVLLVAVLAPTRSRRVLALVAAACCVAALAWSWHRTAAAPTYAYYSTLTRAWELGAGALLAIGATKVARLPRGALAASGVVGLLLIGLAAVRYDDATPFPGLAALLPVTGTVLVLAGGVNQEGTASRLLSLRPLRWVGDVSFSLYLWHWPLLVLPVLALGHPLGPWQRAAAVVAAVALAGLSYRYVEQPFRQQRTWQRRRTALALWPAALVAVIVPATLLGTGSSAPAAGQVELDPDQRGARPSVLLAVQHAAERARDGEPLPARLVPAADSLHDDQAHHKPACFADSAETTHELCWFGDPDGTRTLALYGDSHLGVWVNTLDSIARREGWKVVLLLKLGCPPYDAPVWDRRNTRPNTGCDDYRQWATAQLSELTPERLVLTGKARTALTGPGGTRLEDDKGPGGRTMVSTGMASTLSTMRMLADDVVVLGDTHDMVRPPTSCLTAVDATLASCAGPQHPEVAARNADWARLARAAGARFVDPTPWLCAGGTCPLVVGNVAVYADTDHVSQTYARMLGNLLFRAVFTDAPKRPGAPAVG